MRTILSIALLFAATTLSGQYSYLVPVAGSGSGFQHDYQSDALVTNVGAGTATVRVTTLYLPAPASPCPFPPPQRMLAPGESAHMNPLCGPLMAYAIDSDQPLAVTAAVRIGFVTGCPAGAGAEQKLDVPATFVPANTPAVVGEFKNGQTWRAKLVVINPNDQSITVSVAVSRYDSALRSTVGSTFRTYTVPARALLFQPLEEVPVTPPPNDPDFLIVPEHTLRISSDGEFQAGVSYLSTALHMAEYRGAHPRAR